MQICSNQSVITICAQNSPMHRRIQGLSSWLIKHCIFANIICQVKQTRHYWVPVSRYLWQSRSIRWPMVEVALYQRILDLSLWQIKHSILANPISQSTQTRQYWVLVSEYERWTHLFVAKPQLLLAYHYSSGTPLICIPESRKLRHGSDILGSNSPFAAVVFLADDWRLCTTEIFNPVQNDLLGYVWSQLWQAASHYGCVITAQTHCKSYK